MDTTQVNTVQFGSRQINPREIPISSSIAPEQFFNSHIHHSFPASIYTLNNNALNLWHTLLSPQTKFDINLQLVDLPAGQLAEAQITKYDEFGHPKG
ncbi:hypothetical protein H6F77_12380 [Microcoleus sp. FACHB-831]|uniref:hypothetical protein n=1 Tax=Microcoleus sp. FACHB-831 TaxID=2692827 RepID=UPI0016828B17|nr:hypothetical protein [Microcoleus sp. FACHB-831]MBD1921886.1 hypothetical protein [Microcoleus sp. FACHB-831]